MIKLEDERELRLMVFGAALLAIAARESTLAMGEEPERMGDLRMSESSTQVTFSPPPKCRVLNPPHVHPEYKTEARAIADAVVAEAQRLRAHGTPP
ncbi:MAG: hypothetical protein JWO52_4069 [Gammaproteobacteria bacterium]|nr:hypothetical protein [Gammaproteobacteria bacterium]